MGEVQFKQPIWLRKDETMAKDNKTINRIQAVWNMIGGDEIVDALLQGRATLEIKIVQIFQLIGTIKTLATTKKFVAKDSFKLKKDGGICSCLNEEFVKWFLTGVGKIEDLIGDHTVSYHRPLKGFEGQAIIIGLGGEEKIEVTLVEMFSFMLKQSNREDGILLTDGHHNVFFVRDIDGHIRVVSVGFKDDGWDVHAFTSYCCWKLYDFDRVFSRNY